MSTSTTPAENPSTKPAHTPEPWRIVTTEHKGGSRPPVKAHALTDKTGALLFSSALPNAERIVVCVNACAGMADPAAEIARLRELVDSYRACAAADAIQLGEVRVEKEHLRRNALSVIAALTQPVQTSGTNTDLTAGILRADASFAVARLNEALEATK